MKFVFALVVGMLSLLSNSYSQTKSNYKPNILFILVDDLGYSDLSCMGSKYYETPNIDALASQSMVFTNGYAGCQVCSPSRATIMTGQFTARHGITDWIGAKTGHEWNDSKRKSKVFPAEYKDHIDKSVVTLPKALKKGGYTTFFAGKWHLGDKGNYPEDYGFDINKGGFHSGSPAGGYFAPFKNPKLEDHEKGENLTLCLAKETSNFIKSSKDKPFFAFLSFYAVHAPIQTTKEKWEKYRAKAEKMGFADKGFENGDLLPMRKYQDNPVYAGLIETMDDAVGMVLKTLQETGLDKNTIVIFTSDNGGVTSGDNYSTNCLPFKGGKGYQWEGGIRVPFMVNVPGYDNKGVRNDTPVISSDFYPTILNLARLPLQPEDHKDGKSIVPVLKGKTIDERPLYWHYPHYGNQGGRPVSIIRKGEWKLIHFWEDGHNELYNLNNDIHEDHDLAKKESKRTKVMSKMLLRWLKEVNAQYPKPNPSFDENKEKEAIVNSQKKKIQSLEELRTKMLNKDWEPNPNWWGSIPTID
ncbi:sulfatase [Flavobacterium sp. L1I52]|uniref:Sulfatase n=1 Tax=Flavobacterium pokkalii TaxID=1940408 RepID=A0ABR7UPG3_9FLAO|nr:sulfatase [Flavobacterium pokkalii]MBD0724736.1 sulfatase [Flavobacterium pokkalii]